MEEMNALLARRSDQYRPKVFLTHILLLYLIQLVTEIFSFLFSSFWNFNEIPFSHLRLLLSSRRKAASEKPEDSQNVSACETEMVCNS